MSLQSTSKTWRLVAWVPSMMAIFAATISSLAFYYDLGGNEAAIDTVIAVVFCELNMVICGLGIVAFIKNPNKQTNDKKLLLFNILLLISTGLTGVYLFLSM